MKLEKIYVVFKTHFDIGFTGFVSDVVSRYSTEMLKEVNEICEQTRNNAEHEKYVWTMSSWPLLQSIEGSGAEDRRKALEFVQDRQLIWHMLPFTTHTEFCGLEEWIRGMYISRSLTEQYGYRPKDAKMTDVPGHTWSVPSLLKKAGVHILHLGCNGFSTPPDVPPVFFWEGPDGERLLTFYSKGAYGTGVLPPDDWAHPVWLAMIQTNDNHGPHQASIVDEMKASIAAKGLHGTELHIGSLADFADDFLSRNPVLPVVRGDLADAWIHGVGTAPREVSRVRELRGRIAAAESALTAQLLAGELDLDRSAEVKRLLDDSYEHTLLFGEHTWGMDCKTFLFPRESYDKQSFLQNKRSERYRRMEHSWQEQIDYLNRAERSLTEALAQLGASATSVSRNNAGSGNLGKAIRVYNSLGWSRDAFLTLAPGQLPQEGEALIDCTTGERLRVEVRDGSARVKVKGLPALGYKTIAYVKSPAQERGVETGLGGDGELRSREEHYRNEEEVSGGLLQAYLNESEAVLENEYYIVKVCRKTGWLRSLFDKRCRKEWIEQPGNGNGEAGGSSSSYGFGQYEYNIYSNREITRYIKKYAYRFYDWGVHDFGKTDYPEAQKRLSFSTVLKDLRLIRERDSVKVECTAGTAPESVAEYGNARDIVWSLTLTRDAHIDMEWKLHGKEETPLAESGHIVFPLKLDHPTYRINKMGSVIDPCADVIPYSGTLLHCCEHFVDVSDGNAGIAVVPLDSPLLFVGRNGMWDYEPDYKPEKPELNFNLFNNWWGTNFPQWVGGDLKYRFRLIPHKGDWREGSVWQAAQEAMAGNVLAVETELDNGSALWFACDRPDEGRVDETKAADKDEAILTDETAAAGPWSVNPDEGPTEVAKSAAWNSKEDASSGPLADETAAAGLTQVMEKAGVQLTMAERLSTENSCSSPFALEVLPGGVTGMAVTCFKPAEDGDGYILRLRDWQGEARSVSIGFADFVKEVMKTDLLEYGGEALSFVKPAGSDTREIRMRTGSFEVHTLRVRV